MKVLKKLLTIVVVVAITASLFTFTASAESIAYGAATVSAQTLNLRSSPSTNSSVVATMSENDIIVILEKTNSEWFYINFRGVTGYASAQYFKDVSTTENFNALGVLISDGVRMRAAPNTSSEVLGTYSRNSEMIVIGINNGWYKARFDGKVGYIRSDNMIIVEGYRASSTVTSSSSSSSSSGSSSGSGSSPSSTARSTGNKIVDYALSFVGSRYVNGGTSPSGFDCSGLVYYVYKNFGYTLSRGAGSQFKNNGTAVSKANLIPGDLVFFSSNGNSVTHVGIYIGDNEFVHASTSSTGVIISNLESTYYSRVWFGARRIAS